MKDRRKICVITGSRAEYGLLYWLLQEIQDDPDLDLQIIATGMHLAPEFGLTYKTIERDGFRIAAKVEMLLSSDTPVGIAKSIGVGVIGFADALERLAPDLMVVLGDRFEIFAAAQAAFVARIPIAHISGGETTEGAIDEAIRHSITKMASFHFVASDPYRKRVIQLGESPDRVVNVGDPGLDNIVKLRLIDRETIEKTLGFKLGKLIFLVTYHPATLSNASPEESMHALLGALNNFSEAKIIFTKPNADAGGRVIGEMIDEFSSKQEGRVFVATSLGHLVYLSVMSICDVVIGNSSSGIVEAPFMKKPTVNVGERQKGRLKALSIIECGETIEEITAAINKALSPAFKQITLKSESLYGCCNTSLKIKEILKKATLSAIQLKNFYDIDFSL